MRLPTCTCACHVFVWQYLSYTFTRNKAYAWLTRGCANRLALSYALYLRYCIFMFIVLSKRLLQAQEPTSMPSASTPLPRLTTR